MSIHDKCWQMFFDQNGGVDFILQQLRTSKSGQIELDGSVLANCGKRKNYSGTTKFSATGLVGHITAANVNALKRFLPPHLEAEEIVEVSVRDKRTRGLGIRVILKSFPLARKLPHMPKITLEIDFIKFAEDLGLDEKLRSPIVKAFARYDERSFREAIVNCYLVSESLTRNLFNLLYPNEVKKRIKHEDKLKRIWTDEEKEKHKLPGIKVIASLLSVILWYRNKMGAHIELEPTKEAAEITIMSLLQTLKEFQRLNINIQT